MKDRGSGRRFHLAFPFGHRMYWGPQRVPLRIRPEGAPWRNLVPVSSLRRRNYRVRPRKFHAVRPDSAVKTAGHQTAIAAAMRIQRAFLILLGPAGLKAIERTADRGLRSCIASPEKRSAHRRHTGPTQGKARPPGRWDRGDCALSVPSRSTLCSLCSLRSFFSPPLSGRIVSSATPTGPTPSSTTPCRSVLL